MVKRLFDTNFHEWKTILLFPIKNYIGKYLKFHGPLDIPQHLIKKIPEFQREILLNWSKFLYDDPAVLLTVLSQYLWFNKDIKIRNSSAHFSNFSNHVTSFIGNLVDINGEYKSWNTIKYEYSFTDKEKIQWLQLVHAYQNYG